MMWQEEFIHLADMTGDGYLDVVVFDDINNNYLVFPGLPDFPLGDVNRDGKTSVEDLELLVPFVTSEASPTAVPGFKFDWTGDQLADERDVSHVVEMVFQTRSGDTNLDGRVDFEDYLVLAENYREKGTWRDGDFDGNGEIDFADFLLLSESFGFTEV